MQTLELSSFHDTPASPPIQQAQSIYWLFKLKVRPYSRVRFLENSSREARPLVCLPSGHFAPVCGCPGKAPWLAPGHGWVSWQSPPSRGQRAAGIHPHSAPQLLAASDHSTPPGHSSSCVCVSWVTRETQKVRGWWRRWIIQLGHGQQTRELENKTKKKYFKYEVLSNKVTWNDF